MLRRTFRNGFHVSKSLEGSSKRKCQVCVCVGGDILATCATGPLKKRHPSKTTDPIFQNYYSMGLYTTKESQQIQWENELKARNSIQVSKWVKLSHWSHDCCLPGCALAGASSSPWMHAFLCGMWDLLMARPNAQHCWSCRRRKSLGVMSIVVQQAWMLPLGMCTFCIWELG